jgi:hypothetical protein
MNDVLLCTAEDANGKVYIGLSLKGQQCAMTLEGALLLFERLGDMLVELGVIDDDDDMEVPRCH